MRPITMDRGTGGFSLMELVVVLTIISLMLAMGAASIGSGGHASQVQAATRTLAASLAATRAAAIRSQSPAALTFDLEQRTYHGPGTRSGDVSGRFTDGIEITLRTARRERTKAPGGRIRFFPDGSSTGGIVLLSRGGRMRRIDVDWISGRVTDREAGPDDLTELGMDEGWGHDGG